MANGGYYPDTKVTGPSGAYLVVNSDGSINVGGTVVVSSVSATVPATSRPYTPAAADVLNGSQTVANSVTATTIITIPAGRTWCGSIHLSLVSTAATIIGATVVTTGTNAVPAAGSVLARVNCGGLSSGGFISNATVQTVYAAAPVGNSITLQLVNTSATTNTSSATCNGTLL